MSCDESRGAVILSLLVCLTCFIFSLDFLEYEEGGTCHAMQQQQRQVERAQLGGAPLLRLY